MCEVWGGRVGGGGRGGPERGEGVGHDQVSREGSRGSGGSEWARGAKGILAGGRRWRRETGFEARFGDVRNRECAFEGGGGGGALGGLLREWGSKGQASNCLKSWGPWGPKVGGLWGDVWWVRARSGKEGGEVRVSGGVGKQKGSGRFSEGQWPSGCGVNKGSCGESRGNLGDRGDHGWGRGESVPKRWGIKAGFRVRRMGRQFFGVRVKGVQGG